MKSDYGKALFTPETLIPFVSKNIAIRAAVFERADNGPYDEVVIFLLVADDDNTVCVEYGPCTLMDMTHARPPLLNAYTRTGAAMWFNGQARDGTQTAELFSKRFAVGKRIQGCHGEHISATALVFLPHYGAILATMQRKEWGNSLVTKAAERLARFLRDSIEAGNKSLSNLVG